MIIGFAGYKGTGKDTAGSVLTDRYGFNKMSFAAPMKSLVADIFGIDKFMLEGNDCKLRALREDKNMGAYGKSPRELLQVFGTGMRHIISEDIWVDMALKQCIADENYVFTDVRFVNEVEAIHNKGGLVIGIRRDGFNGDSHESERALDNYALPYVIGNEGTEEELKGKVNRLLLAKFKL